MILNRRAFTSALAASMMTPAARTARAQTYPTKPIKLVIPFAVGGAADLFARPLAAGLSAELGQQVVVEARAGAGGLTGVDAVAKSTPDGYTLCLAGAAALSAIPFMVAKMPFDWQKDLALITNVVKVPEVAAVSSSLGVNTFAEFIAYARANPGKINFGSAGVGSITHLAAELLKIETKINIVHVPYRGVGPAITDMLGGHIQLLVSDIPFLLPQIQAGTLKPLAVTSGARSAALPNVPTTAEVGYPAVTSDNWYGLVAPAGTPPDALDKLRQAAQTALRSADLKRQFDTQHAVPAPSSPEEFAAFIKAEQAKWGPVVAATGVKLE
jgi:tripartite-type tricarboxylate transporter receptor subunit TctC